MAAPVALVTGGASGIGAATAACLSAQGNRVIVADRNELGASACAGEIGGHAVVLDISSESDVAHAIEDIEGRFGPISRLVNCAGPLQNTEFPDALPMRIWDRITNVHLRGTYLVTVAVGSRMARRGVGSIVTIASVVGMRSGPLHAYGPAKAALINLCEGLAAEWGPYGVRVNSVSPGFVRTPATARGFAEAVIDAPKLEKSAALRRLVDVDEVVAAIDFLLSDRASGITGCNLPVDAGFLVASSWATYGERPTPA